jgi:hypothetical protein
MGTVKRVLWPVTLTLSLAMLLLLACGYVARLEVGRFTPASSQSQPAGKVTSLALEMGRVRWLAGTFVPPPQIPAGTHVFAGFVPLRLDQRTWSQALWGFDAHALEGSSAVSGLYIVAFPIWCAALPWLIAPALWLRKWHQRRQAAQGFDVLSPSPTPASTA